MALLNLSRGEKMVGFENFVADEATLAPAAQNPDSIIDILLLKQQELEVLVEGKVDRGAIKSEIAFSDEAVKIQAGEIVLVGNVTIVDIINEQNGTTSGIVDPSITRIIGDKIQTGIITSNNWGAAQGTAIDLDSETLTLGGSASPDFYYDGAGNLSLRGTLSAGVIATAVTVGGVTTMGDIETHANTTGSNPHNTPLSTIAGDLDDIADGSTYFKSTATQNTGGTRAANALNSSFNYVRSLSTQNIVVSGTNPTNGLVIDSSGMRAYDGGSLTLEISASTGGSTWSGNISTSGQVYAEGSTSASGLTACFIGLPSANIPAFATTTSGANGFEAEAANSTDIGFYGLATGMSAVGVSGSSTSSLGSGLKAANVAGGPALTMQNPIIAGDVRFEDDVDIDLTLNVDGIATFNNDLSVGLSGFFGATSASGDSSVCIGSGLSPSGTNTLIIAAGSAATATAGQVSITAGDSGGITRFHFVDEGGPSVASGGFAVNYVLPVYVNGALKYLGLSDNP